MNQARKKLETNHIGGDPAWVNRHRDESVGGVLEMKLLDEVADRRFRHPAVYRNHISHCSHFQQGKGTHYAAACMDIPSEMDPTTLEMTLN